MKILLIGSGGREHALAWKLADSPRCSRLFIAPGNDGMAALGTLVNLQVEDGTGLTAFAVQNKIDLVVIGPEAALAAGVSDVLRAEGIAVFAPSQAAAQLETSKVFSKRFMAQHHIPTARFAVFDRYLDAKKHLEAVNYPIVIKASGLAAGKGVFLPKDHEEALSVLYEMMVTERFGLAGKQIVIEERLEGQEVSLLAFSDGESLQLMPPVQDHKRLLNEDQGPNTGGMGTFAPTNILSDSALQSIHRTILQPVINGMRQEGTPYLGVLYTGLILTKNGPKVLEFNARFGDPETQVILPLLESDLVDILIACTRQELKNINIDWSKKAAVCVVLASEGYPNQSQTGKIIEGLETLIQNGLVFHAATRKTKDGFITTGGRVLGVTCWDESMPAAIQRTYAAVEGIHFEGMQYRTDIAQNVLKQSKKPSSYQEAGVNIDAGNQAVVMMKTAVQSTYTPQVLSEVGSFGGLYDISQLETNAVLVASTDGVGTKVALAAQLGRYRGIGMDIVNHCVDDILVQGAKPLFFLDYFATAHLDPAVVAEIVAGMAEACKQNGCALLGGETAEMPGVYTDHSFDVAGTIVGVVNRSQILPKKENIKAGDVLVGFSSNSPHTNGYSLIRRLCKGEDLLIERPELGGSLADLLLRPHRSYLGLIFPILDKIKALVHITGGGFYENIPRVLPDHLGAYINQKSWLVPPLYGWIQAKGSVPQKEMYRVFNMGIGMIAIMEKAEAINVQSLIPEKTYLIGELRENQNDRVILYEK
jgi:phosphoribosylamine--glycine ligase/phosphoribosylformylglycinamidine cyclo-ligase